LSVFTGLVHMSWGYFLLTLRVRSFVEKSDLTQEHCIINICILIVFRRVYTKKRQLKKAVDFFNL